MVAAGNPQQPAENGVVCDFKVSAWETPRSCISASPLKEGARGPLHRPAAKPKYPIDHKLGCGIGRQSARPLNYLFQHCSLLNYRQNRGTDLITVSQQEPDSGRWEGGAWRPRWWSVSSSLSASWYLTWYLTPILLKSCSFNLILLHSGSPPQAFQWFVESCHHVTAEELQIRWVQALLPSAA